MCLNESVHLGVGKSPIRILEKSSEFFLCGFEVVIPVFLEFFSLL